MREDRLFFGRVREQDPPRLLLEVWVAAGVHEAWELSVFEVIVLDRKAEVTRSVTVETGSPSVKAVAETDTSGSTRTRASISFI